MKLYNKQAKLKRLKEKLHTTTNWVTYDKIQAEIEKIENETKDN